jgi:hypothetical protein
VSGIYLLKCRVPVLWIETETIVNDDAYVVASTPLIRFLRDAGLWDAVLPHSYALKTKPENLIYTIHRSSLLDILRTEFVRLGGTHHVMDERDTIESIDLSNGRIAFAKSAEHVAHTAAAADTPSSLADLPEFDLILVTSMIPSLEPHIQRFVATNTSVYNSLYRTSFLVASHVYNPETTLSTLYQNLIRFDTHDSLISLVPVSDTLLYGVAYSPQDVPSFLVQHSDDVRWCRSHRPIDRSQRHIACGRFTFLGDALRCNTSDPFFADSQKIVDVLSLMYALEDARKHGSLERALLQFQEERTHSLPDERFALKLKRFSDLYQWQRNIMLCFRTVDSLRMETFEGLGFPFLAKWAVHGRTRFPLRLLFTPSVSQQRDVPLMMGMTIVDVDDVDAGNAAPSATTEEQVDLSMSSVRDEAWWERHLFSRLLRIARHLSPNH